MVILQMRHDIFTSRSGSVFDFGIVCVLGISDYWLLFIF